MAFFHRRPRLLHAGSSLFLAAILFVAVRPVVADSSVEPFVTVAAYDGVINPVAAEYIHDALVSAEANGARALVIALNTPGGLDSSMRLIIKDMTGATVPVVVFVSPSPR